MQTRVLDLDGALIEQAELLSGSNAPVISMQDWGPRLRLACSFSAYQLFEHCCAERLPADDGRPAVTFYGSGDFHHVTLALLRRLRHPFNLLVLDKHPDWMRGVPVLHCGTWLYHTLKLPHLRRVFHLGGDLDFDNAFRWLAPWRELLSGKIVVLPGVRRYERGRWRNVANQPLRLSPEEAITSERLDVLLRDARADLSGVPLYISLDKDVMHAADALVNWDSGYLELSEVQTILAWFVAACGGNLAGMDILGDWSPVAVRGIARRFLHALEHPKLDVDARAAASRNARTNLLLLATMQALLVRYAKPQAA